MAKTREGNDRKGQNSWQFLWQSDVRSVSDTREPKFEGSDWRPSIGCSVTRFGEILPLWKIFKSLWEIFGMVYFEFGKQLYLLCVTFYATKQIFIVVNGQRLKNNLAIWSHWLVVKLLKSAYFLNFVFSIQFILNNWINFCRWLDSNGGPLVSEATALPTKPQPLPSGQSYNCSMIVNYDSRGIPD